MAKFCLLTFFFILFVSHAKSQAVPFKAPSWADTLHNPLKGNSEAQMAGKKIYTSFCAVCHGDKGKGDGVGAAGLAKRPADHTSKLVQEQTDGALFWMITNGNNPMPAYKQTLTEMQRWQVIDFIRSLASKTKK